MQGELFYDDEHAALRATLEMLGVKRVAGSLWPSKPLKDAQRLLLHCVDPERQEKLALDELFFICRMAREKGIHIMAEYFGQSLDYDIKPITKEQKQATLCEKWQSMRGEVLALAEQMSRLPE